jgi:hypothetical protein
MPEWGVTGTMYLQQITSYAFTAQSPLFGLKPQPEFHLASSRTTTSSYSPLPYSARSACATAYIAARQQAWGAAGIVETHWTSVDNRDSRLDSREGQGNLLFSKTPRPDLRPTHFPIHRVLGAFPRRVKRLWREADRSLPYSINVQKWWMFLHSSHMPSWHRGKYKFFYLSCFFSVATQMLYLTHPNSTTS